MPLPRVKFARWVLLNHDGTERRAGEGGHPYIHIEFEDGRDAYASPEQKLLMYDVPAVFLDASWEDETAVRLPANPEQGWTGGDVMRGFTDEPAVVRLVREFWRAARAGSIEPKTIDLGPDPPP